MCFHQGIWFIPGFSEDTNEDTLKSQKACSLPSDSLGRFFRCWCLGGVGRWWQGLRGVRQGTHWSCQKQPVEALVWKKAVRKVPCAEWCTWKMGKRGCWEDEATRWIGKQWMEQGLVQSSMQCSKGVLVILITVLDSSVLHLISKISSWMVWTIINVL